MAAGSPQPNPPDAGKNRLPGRVMSKRSQVVSTEVHSLAMTVFSSLAASSASRMASALNSGPGLVEQVGSVEGLQRRSAGGRQRSASRARASDGSPMTIWPTGARAASSGSEVTRPGPSPAAGSRRRSNSW